MTAAQPGTCQGTDTACTSSADCGGGTCEGFVAPEATFGECNCGCPTEVGRWITTYGREGRWVSDHTPFLALLQEGGTQRIRLNSGNPYYFDLKLRLIDTDAPARPSELIPLFDGFGYAPDWSGAPESKEVTIPAGAVKVELFAYITGHGFGVDTDNCYEFCNHEHHFWIGGQEYVHDFPMAGTNSGCTQQIPDGTVPNQYGTWYLGRGGWCPGMDVKPLRVDVTSSLTPGETTTIEYKSLLDGEPWVPTPAASPGGGFHGNVVMNSWLVIYQ
jgi:hypothetical protein